MGESDAVGEQFRLLPLTTQSCVGADGREQLFVRDLPWLQYFNKEYGREDMESDEEQEEEDEQNEEDEGEDEEMIREDHAIDFTNSPSLTPSRLSILTTTRPSTPTSTSPLTPTSAPSTPSSRARCRRSRHTRSVKHFLPWMLTLLTRDELRLLLEGYRRAHGAWKQHKKVLYTSSVLMRDELMIALLHAGYSSWFSLMRRAGTIVCWVYKCQREDSNKYSPAEYGSWSAEKQVSHSLEQPPTSCLTLTRTHHVLTCVVALCVHRRTIDQFGRLPTSGECRTRRMTAR